MMFSRNYPFFSMFHIFGISQKCSRCFSFFGGSGENYQSFPLFVGWDFFMIFFQYFGLIGPERRECTCYILAAKYVETNIQLGPLSPNFGHHIQKFSEGTSK